MNNCGVCNKCIPLDHACQSRIENDRSLTSYHLNCNVNEVKVCSDCSYHRNFCNECAD